MIFNKFSTINNKLCLKEISITLKSANSSLLKISIIDKNSFDKTFLLIEFSFKINNKGEFLKNILTLTLKRYNGKTFAYEVGLPTEEGIILPCGASGIFVSESAPTPEILKGDD